MQNSRRFSSQDADSSQRSRQGRGGGSYGSGSYGRRYQGQGRGRDSQSQDWQSTRGQQNYQGFQGDDQNDQMDAGYYGGFQGRQGSYQDQGSRSNNQNRWTQDQDYQNQDYLSSGRDIDTSRGMYQDRQNQSSYGSDYGQSGSSYGSYGSGSGSNYGSNYGTGSTMGYNSQRGSNYGTGNTSYGQDFGSQNNYGGGYRGDSTYDSDMRSESGFGTPYGSGSPRGGRQTQNDSAYDYTTRGMSGRSEYASGSARYGYEDSTRGQFYGQGPKGYSRSDDRIKEDVSQALMDAPHVDATEIEVEVSQGVVTLTGTVTERRMKRMAEDCVENLQGVKDVHNQIKVQSSPSTGSSYESAKADSDFTRGSSSSSSKKNGSATSTSSTNYKV